MANNTNIAGLWRTIATALDASADTSLPLEGYMRKTAEALNPGNPSAYVEDEWGYLTRIAVAKNAGGTQYNGTILGLLKRIAEGVNAGNPSNYQENTPGLLTRISLYIGGVISNFALREDGSKDLREDGSFELRE